MKIRVQLLVLLAASLLAGCGQDNEKISERAKTEALGAISAEEERAKAMEEDLARRHRFYQSVKGTYEGTLTTDAGTWDISITLVPSIAPFAVTRVRTVEEISSDLTNLYFNGQVVQGPVGCPIEGVRPDLAKGELYIASSACDNFYAIKLGNNIGPATSSETIAVQAIEGRISQIGRIFGEMRPRTSISKYSFSASRKTE